MGATEPTMVKFHELRTSRYGDTGGFNVGTIADVEFELEFEDIQVVHLPKMAQPPVFRTPCRCLHDPGRIEWGPGHGDPLAIATFSALIYKITC